MLAFAMERDGLMAKHEMRINHSDDRASMGAVMSDRLSRTLRVGLAKHLESQGAATWIPEPAAWLILCFCFFWFGTRPWRFVIDTKITITNGGVMVNGSFAMVVEPSSEDRLNNQEIP